MNQSLPHSLHPYQPAQETDVIEQAMAAFLLNAVDAKTKNRKIKHNMECRRKLEIKREEQRLEKEIAEFQFN